MLLAATVLVVAGLGSVRRAPELGAMPPASSHRRSDVAPVEPARALPALPPGSGVAWHPGTSVRGVLCPDGSRLPLLNGVPDAPPIARAAHLGPLPAVVGLIVDASGCAWYEHADGSVTTTRFRDAIADGVRIANIETVHSARLPDRAGRRLPTTER